MRRLHMIALMISLLLVAALAGSALAQETPTPPTATPTPPTATPTPPMVGFRATLTGEEEVVDGMTGVVQTEASGEALFLVSEDGTGVHFQLTVSDIADMNQAHIHLGAPGENGPVVVWLYPVDPPMVPIPGVITGVVAQATFTGQSLVGPLAGRPLSDLVEAMESGEAYVNVHTSQYPAGEIRGQIAEEEFGP